MRCFLRQRHKSQPGGVFRLNSNIKDFRGENVDVGPGINTGLGSEKLLFVDSDIIVVDKPSCAQTAPGFHDKDSLATRISKLFNIERIDKMIVHRLDYATSGVVVFARNDDALKNLHEQFRKQTPRKTYTAIVGGVINSSFEGEIDLFLGRDGEKGPPYCKVVSSDTPRSKRSMTYWSIEKQGMSVTKVILRPKTGRTHQLRIHMQAIGHPILGDLFYAPPDLYLRSPERLLLHASDLHIAHPRSGVPLSLHAPCPFRVEDFDL